MFITSGELTPLSLGLIGMALLFGMQLALCFRARIKLVKCIPLIFIIAGFIYSIAAYAGIFGSHSAGAISGNQIVSILLFFILGAAAIGVGLAWIVYWLKIRKK